MRYKVLFILFLTFGIAFSLNAQMKDKDIYFFDDFKEGEVRFKNGLKSKEKLNFSFFYNQLCFLEPRTDMIMLAKDVDKIAAISIDGRVYCIIGKNFYEIINDKPLVQVQYKKNVRKVSKGAYGTTTETAAVESFLSKDSDNRWKRNENDISSLKIGNLEQIYSIHKDGKIEQFRTSKQFQKLYPGHENEIKKYIKDNSIKFDDNQKILELVEYAEGL